MDGKGKYGWPPRQVVRIWMVRVVWMATRSFHTRAIDLVVLHGKVLRYLIVCVDVYTKWVEAAILNDKGSRTVA